MTIPLRHFFVGIGFLMLGAIAGLGTALGVDIGFASVVHVHLLLVGWVCVTIMGAMTQFVPVWSGVQLHSKRLADVQLVLVVAGLLGLVIGLSIGWLSWLPIPGAILLAGFWIFVYNVGRTLGRLEAFDVTERHFFLALGFFLVVTLLGFALAVDFTVPVFERLSQSRSNARNAHATLAVFGAILTTIYGAVYQLGTMFTQTELHGIDRPLQALEELAHPTGVVLLATGRYLEWVAIGRVGGGLVIVAAVSVSLVIGRKLVEMRVPWTPMHTRYGIVATALAIWALLSAPPWLQNPVDTELLFGTPGAGHLLVLGVVGFVVMGTLYHIVPFIVWIHRYSDRLGYDDVPMIDDLYSDRLARVDGIVLVVGTVSMLASEIPPLSLLEPLGGVLISIGILLFAVNMLSVVRQHSPRRIRTILAGSLGVAVGNGPALDQEGATDDDRSVPERPVNR